MLVLNAILPSVKVQRMVPLVAYHARIFMKKKIGCQNDVSLNAILPSDNGLAYGVIHIFVSHLEIAGQCLRGEFPWDFWHVLCHHLDKTHIDVQFRCHSYTMCRLESLYIFVPPMNFFLSFSFSSSSPSPSMAIFFNGCRKYKICPRSADLLAIKGSFNFEVWVPTWEWEGLFVLPRLMSLSASQNKFDWKL